MPATELDPYLIRPQASSGNASTEPDAIDQIIAKINEVINEGTAGGGYAFVYECDGTEGSSFTVAIPTPRESTDYIAHVQGISGALRIYRAPQSGYALAELDVDSSAPVSAGDKLAITITDVA